MWFPVGFNLGVMSWGSLTADWKSCYWLVADGGCLERSTKHRLSREWAEVLETVCNRLVIYSVCVCANLFHVKSPSTGTQAQWTFLVLWNSWAFGARTAQFGFVQIPKIAPAYWETCCISVGIGHALVAAKLFTAFRQGIWMMQLPMWPWTTWRLVGCKVSPVFIDILNLTSLNLTIWSTLLRYFGTSMFAVTGNVY